MITSESRSTPGPPPLLRARDLAAALSVAEATVWGWRRYGDVPALEVGTAVRFCLDDVLGWVRGGGPARAAQRRRELLAARAGQPDAPRHAGGRPRSRPPGRAAEARP